MPNGSYVSGDVFLDFYGSEVWADFVLMYEVSGFSFHERDNIVIAMVYFPDGNQYYEAVDNSFWVPGMEAQAIHRVVDSIAGQREAHQQLKGLEL